MSDNAREVLSLSHLFEPTGSDAAKDSAAGSCSIAPPEEVADLEMIDVEESQPIETDVTEVSTSDSFLKLDEAQLDGVDESSRFSRFELIGWWDQTRLKQSNALVIGAGALGNELIKNLALLGVGHLVVADLDDIENSNLSRSILYRAEDCGKAKAVVAAERAGTIYPEMQAQAFVGNVVYDLGLGVYRWADVILGGLDNREARVAMNAAAARCGKPWIDGAIEQLGGVARVFDAAAGPCYECTMNETDWKMLEARRSCALLTREQMEGGKVPTTPTTSSVVAGVQAQEAVKLLHGLETLSGQGFVFDGISHQSYVVNYTRREDCWVHEPFTSVTETGLSATQTTAGELLEYASSSLGSEAVIELNHDLLNGLTCVNCNTTEQRFGSLGTTSERDGVCPNCGSPRSPELYHTLDRTSDLLDLKLSRLGVPLWEIVTARVGMEQMHFELSGDRDAVLGAAGKDDFDA